MAKKRRGGAIGGQPRTMRADILLRRIVIDFPKPRGRPIIRVEGEPASPRASGRGGYLFHDILPDDVTDGLVEGLTMKLAEFMAIDLEEAAEDDDDGDDGEKAA